MCHHENFCKVYLGAESQSQMLWYKVCIERYHRESESPFVVAQFLSRGQKTPVLSVPLVPVQKICVSQIFNSIFEQHVSPFLISILVTVFNRYFPTETYKRNTNGRVALEQAMFCKIDSHSTCLKIVQKSSLAWDPM